MDTMESLFANTEARIIMAYKVYKLSQLHQGHPKIILSCCWILDLGSTVIDV